MTAIVRKINEWSRAHARAIAANVAFTGAMGTLAVGLWWERPSLALIVPSVIIIAAFIWDRITPQGGTPDA